MIPKLWKFSKAYGRMGSLSSIFFATDEQIEILKQNSIYLDDVLGKHSEVNVYFDETNLYEIKLSEESRAELFKATGSFVGGDFYPFDFEDQWRGL